MRSTDTKIIIIGTKLGESEKAIKWKVTHVDGQELSSPSDQWFPLSQISKIFTDPNAAGKDYIIVSQWICEQKKMFDLPIRTNDDLRADAMEEIDIDNLPELDPEDDVPF